MIHFFVLLFSCYSIVTKLRSDKISTCPKILNMFVSSEAPCDSDPCGEGFRCTYSSTLVNGNYYKCTGKKPTTSWVKLLVYRQHR